MSLRKEIEKSFTRENTEVDAVEDHGIKDSILELASADFKEKNVLDLPLVDRKRSQIDVSSDYPGKSVSRKKYGLDVGVESEDENSDVENGFGDEVDEEEKESSVEEEEMSEEGEESNENSSEGSDDEQTDDEEVTEEQEEESLRVFSETSPAPAELKKGLAVKEQLRVWESLLECRIKLEPSLGASNQLLQLSKMKDFEASMKSSGSTDVESALSALQDLSNSWRVLQEALFMNKTEQPSKKRKIESKPAEDSDDESIASSEASGVNEKDESDVEVDQANVVPPRHQKPLTLNESYANFSTYRDDEISSWNEKAKVTSGRAAQRDFSAFDQSILKLIESILFDKYRLVKKTQQKRLDYVIYGKTEQVQPQKEATLDDDELSTQKEKNKKLTVYDPEIFDDGDFYQKLLRDFIEGKSSDGGISKHERKLMELHRMRIKMKRKIDTKATKGRKLRYIVHQKLVNFMAPELCSSFSEEGDNQLMKSLFGQVANSST